MSRADAWVVGDLIIDARWRKPRRIKTISVRPSTTKVTTTQGHTIIGEDLDFWDLVLPDLEWTHESGQLEQDE